VTWRTAWCVECRGKAWRRSEYSRKVWEPEESPRKSNDLDKKMIRCTFGKVLEIWWKSKKIVEGSFRILWETTKTTKTTKTSKTTKTIKNHQIWYKSKGMVGSAPGRPYQKPPKPPKQTKTTKTNKTINTN